MSSSTTLLGSYMGAGAPLSRRSTKPPTVRRTKPLAGPLCWLEPRSHDCADRCEQESWHHNEMMERRQGGLVGAQPHLLPPRNNRCCRWTAALREGNDRERCGWRRGGGASDRDREEERERKRNQKVNNKHCGFLALRWKKQRRKE